MPHRLAQLDHRLTDWMNHHGIRLLRISIGFIFVLFGAFKLVHGMSPAEDLVHALMFKISAEIPNDLFFHVLGLVEMLIGLGLLFQVQLRAVLLLLFAQMAGTFLPLLLLPEMCFNIDPLGLTFEGQYILKNLILVSGALVVGGTLAPQGQHVPSASSLPDWYADHRYPKPLMEQERLSESGDPVPVPPTSIL